MARRVAELRQSEAAPAGLQIQALEAFVARLRAGKDWTDNDEPLVAAAYGLALAVDSKPDDARLWAQYRAAIADLRGVADRDTDDESAEFRDSVRTKVGDTPKS